MADRIKVPNMVVGFRTKDITATTRCGVQGLLASEESTASSNEVPYRKRRANEWRRVSADSITQQVCLLTPLHGNNMRFTS